MESTIKWHTGEPKECGNYIISCKNGHVGTAFLDAWVIKPDVWKKYLKDEVVDWCKLSDIEPYKLKTK